MNKDQQKTIEVPRRDDPWWAKVPNRVCPYCERMFEPGELLLQEPGRLIHAHDCTREKRVYRPFVEAPPQGIGKENLKNG